MEIGKLIKVNNDLILVNNDQIELGDKYYFNGMDYNYPSTLGEPPIHSKKIVSKSPFIKLSKEISEQINYLDEEDFIKDILGPDYFQRINKFGSQYKLMVECFRKTLKLNQNRISEVFDWLEKKDYLSDSRKNIEEEFNQTGVWDVEYTVVNEVYFINKLDGDK